MFSKQYFIAVLAFFHCLCLSSQITPDSLIGTYAGERWFKWEEDTNWTITPDTLYVIDIHTKSCYMDVLYSNGSSGTPWYETSYYFCHGNSSNFFDRFHSNDSLTSIWDDYSPPPPNYHVRSKRFYSKKISDSILVNIIEKPDFNEQVKIYPSPFTNHLHMQLSISQKCEIKIFDINGKELYALTKYNIDNSTINTTALVPGVYILQLVINNKMQSYKIVKL